MFERFGQDARRAVVRAIDEEAPRLGARRVEAEHLLLSLAADRGPAGRLLAEAGLGHEALRAALELEERHSLVAVGIDAGDLGADALPAPTGRAPGLGASAKRALERAASVAVARKDRRIGPAHLLAGVLSAELGTVPRALAGAGQDRTALLRRAEALMG